MNRLVREFRHSSRIADYYFMMSYHIFREFTIILGDLLFAVVGYSNVASSVKRRDTDRIDSYTLHFPTIFEIYPTTTSLRLTKTFVIFILLITVCFMPI